MSAALRKVGQWARAGKFLTGVSAKLDPHFRAMVDEAGNLLLEKMSAHIGAQDLGWAPLAESTVALKNGDETVYVETGFLRDNIKVRRIGSANSNYSIFVGADAWTTHAPSGEKFSEIMIWMEYGTDRMPPRPLIAPTWEEMRPEIERLFEAGLRDLIARESR
jgi:hypothetical protein